MTKSIEGMSYTVKAESEKGEQMFDVFKRRHNYIIYRYSDSNEYLCHSAINTLSGLMNEIQVIYDVKVTAIKHSHSENFRPYP